MEEHTLTKIEIITRPSKLEELKEALNKIGVMGMTVSQVFGCGLQKGYVEVYRGQRYNINLLPGIKVEPSSAKSPSIRSSKSPKRSAKQAVPVMARFSSTPYQTPSVFVPVTAVPKPLWMKNKEIQKNRYAKRNPSYTCFFWMQIITIHRHREKCF